eukprot:scaffold206395_cov26-Cyclotella_meneghiniana.AAC.1
MARGRRERRRNGVQGSGGAIWVPENGYQCTFHVQKSRATCHENSIIRETRNINTMFDVPS